MLSAIKDFLKLEAAGGIVLLAATILAIIISNSPLNQWYQLLIDMPVEVRIGPLEIAKPLLLWINDGLMAIFFFLIGLELKREILEGELSDVRKIALPAIGAIGGMAFPAFLYAYINWDDPVALKGWAIPAATDIAFALGVLALLGKRVPLTLKVFLVTVAIFDDIGAILIIACFYTSGLSPVALLVGLGLFLLLWALNSRNVTTVTPYVIIGVIIWVAILKSGVHATLAGIAVALFIPLKDPKATDRSPLKELEHDLHTSVAFGVLPVFAFVNAGISFDNMTVASALHSVTVGIALGLFLGKQLGIFACCWIGVKTGIAKLPEGVTWPHLYGVALLCGVGFTMSLFIGSLAFEETGVNLMFDERLGIIVGSLLSGTIGYVVLRSTLNKDRQLVDES